MSICEKTFSLDDEQLISIQVLLHKSKEISSESWKVNVL